MPGPEMNAGLDAGPAELHAVAVAVLGPGFEEIFPPLLRTAGPPGLIHPSRQSYSDIYANGFPTL